MNKIERWEGVVGPETFRLSSGAGIAERMLLGGLDRLGAFLIARAPWLLPLGRRVWAWRDAAARPAPAPSLELPPWEPTQRPSSGELPVPLLSLMELLADLPPLTMALGLADAERPVVLSLTDDGVGHTLIAGDAGAGKSTLLRSMLLSLAGGNRPSTVQLLVGQAPAARGRQGSLAWEPFDYLPHMLAPFMSDAGDVAAALAFLREEMIYRQEQGYHQPRLVLALDDLDALLERAPDSVKADLQALAQGGPEAGIHLLASCREPAALDNILRAGFTLRLLGRLADRRQAYAADPADDGEALTARRLQGAGDFLAVVDGSATRFQAAAYTTAEMAWSLGQIQTRYAGALVARPVHSRPHMAAPERSESSRVAASRRTQPEAANDTPVELAPVDAAEVLF